MLSEPHTRARFTLRAAETATSSTAHPSRLFGPAAYSDDGYAQVVSSNSPHYASMVDVEPPRMVSAARRPESIAP